LILSTSIHKLCDGLVVGASFADSMSTGLSTAIAIVCHEIPHEIGNLAGKLYIINKILNFLKGDYALFIRFGFNHLQALFINFLTSISCYIGFYVGASIAETTAPDWILCVTAGTFLYIALVELVNINNILSYYFLLIKLLSYGTFYKSEDNKIYHIYVMNIL